MVKKWKKIKKSQSFYKSIQNIKKSNFSFIVNSSAFDQLKFNFSAKAFFNAYYYI